MKNIIKLSTLAIICFSTVANAQIKVMAPTGKVKIGIENPIGYAQDPLEEVTLHVFGPNGDPRAGGKIAIGDYSECRNVLVGEYGNDDVDQLWLQGRQGMYLTSGVFGENVIGFYDYQNFGNVFHFNSDVYSSGSFVASDQRFKTNVQKLGNDAMDQIKKLQGVSYNLLPHELNLANQSGKAKRTLPAGTNLSEKDRKAFEEDRKREEDMNKPGPKRIGLIAQEVQKVFPELVRQDSTNYLYVDYLGLIPVMIEGMKEQEGVIDAQNAKIKELENQINSIDAKMTGIIALSNPNATDAQNAGLTNSFLYQNTPNPFNATTQINYFIISTVKSATINIFDMQGNMIKAIPLKGTGKGSISIMGAELKAGMYIYNLITDGQESDVKRMTLIK